MTLALALLLAPALLCAQPRFAGSPQLDAAIEEGIQKELLPGAVCLVGRLDTQGRPVILHRQAYGHRALVPAREVMTVDTIFDAASLTKVIATTSSVMKLFEQGKIRLNDKVTDYLPGFQHGKSTITVRHLLTHFSGLRPDLDLKPAWSGYETGIEKALIDPPIAEPGERMIYSDINFILLGEIVHQVSGKPLDEFARVLRPKGEIIIANHIGAESGPMAVFEKWAAPIARSLGWRADFPLQRIRDWAGRSGFALISAEKVWPMGYFMVIRLKRRAG